MTAIAANQLQIHFRFLIFLLLLTPFPFLVTGSDSNSSSVTIGRQSSAPATNQTNLTTGSGSITPTPESNGTETEPTYKNWDEALAYYKDIWFTATPFTSGFGFVIGMLVVATQSNIVFPYDVFVLLNIAAGFDCVNETLLNNHFKPEPEVTK